MADIICFVAGKSGGHIIPCLAQAKKEKQNNPHVKILFFSTTNTLDKVILQQQSFVDHIIYLPSLSIPMRKWLYPLFLIQFCYAFFKSFIYLMKFKPHNIVSMGELISIPVCMAGRLLRIPITLYELNATPGKAVLWLVPLARRIYVCFVDAGIYFPAHKTVLIEYPLRFNTASICSPLNALEMLHLANNRKTIFVLGGSQGSLMLDNIIRMWIMQHEDLLGTIQIIHQTAPGKKSELITFYRNIGIPAFVFDYYNSIETCYSAADVVVCRAGAGTLFEVKFFQKFCITIPLETISTAHQYDNAVHMAAQLGTSLTVIRQKAFIDNNKAFSDALAYYLT